MSTILRDLWPDDIRTEGMLPPEEILRQQAEHLEKRTNGLLIADVLRTETADRVILGFEVYAPRINSRVRLFGAQHRAEDDYPVAIEPPKDDLPAFLKESYYRPGTVESAAAAVGNLGLTGHVVKNEWIADSPMEFTEKVGRVLALPAVKARVVSLISRSSVPADASHGQSSDSSCDETQEHDDVE